jgi:hypothetical protein
MITSETQVDLANLGGIQANRLRVGNLVVTRKSNAQIPNDFRYYRISAIAYKSAEVWVLTTLDGRQVKASNGHKFLTITGWISIQDLQPGDKIFGRNPGIVAEAHKIFDSYPVVSISVPDAGTYQTLGLLNQSA